MTDSLTNTYDILAAALKVAKIDDSIQRERYYFAWDNYFEGPRHIATLQHLPNWQDIRTQPSVLRPSRPIVQFTICDHLTDAIEYLGWLNRPNTKRLDAIEWIEISFPVPSHHWLLAQCGDLADDTDFR